MEFRPRVIVDQMPELRGKCVIQLGQVIYIDPNGKRFNIKDCSNQTVIVFIRQPMDATLAVNSWVEIEGKVKGKGAMDGERITILKESLCKNFDADIYLATVLLADNIQIKSLISPDDNSEHHGSIEGRVELLNESKEIGDEESDPDCVILEGNFLEL